MFRQNRTLPKTESLETFVTIVDTGSLSAAARRIGVSKSVVSQRLASLEDELGVRLLQRSARKLRMTNEGSAFYDVAVRLVRDLQEAAATLAERQGVLVGPLRLSAPMSFSVLHLGRALFPFMEKHPQIDLYVDLNDRMVDVMGEGFDMAVRIGRLPDSSLVARKLTTSRRVVVMSPDYADRHGLPRSLEDLEEHEAITYALSRIQNDWQFSVGGKTETVRIRSRFQVNNGELQRDAAIAGLGIALIPTFIVSDAIASGKLIVAPLGAEPLVDTVYAVYPQNRHLSAKVRVLADHLRATFGDPPYWDKNIFDSE